jgi:transposase
MIQISPQSKIFVCDTPLDFRSGFNGTAAACRLRLAKNPLEGGLFIFINKNRTMLRLYLFDGHGENLFTRRIAQGHFKWWQKGHIPSQVSFEHIALLLRGADPSKVILPEPWKKLD